MSNEIRGVIQSIKQDKGYGFIEVEGYERGIFFHSKDCRGINLDQLREGDTVTIGQIVTKEKGPSARNVSLVR